MIEYRKYDISTDVLTEPAFNKVMSIEHYVMLDCINPRNQTPIHIILLKTDSKYIKATPMFKKLMLSLGKSSSSVIIVSKEYLSIYIKKILPTFANLSIHNYLHRHFIIEIPKGPLCCKHTILTQDEVRDLCNNELMSHPASLPSILVNDPQCIWIGAEVGQIVKCTALSEMAGYAIRYRMVVPINLGEAPDIEAETNDAIIIAD